MIIVSEAAVRETVTFADVIDAVAAAFASLHSGASEPFPVVRGASSDGANFFAFKAGRDASTGFVGVKLGSYCPGNKSLGEPAHGSTVLLVGEQDGTPYALVSARHLNGMRTAAANAVAAKHLARADASTLGIVGTGHQAVYEVEALTHVRPLERVLAVKRDPARFDAFAAAVAARTGLAVTAGTPEAVARAADILVTVTPSTAPLVERAWVRAGTHIAAMGADNVGKQELDPGLVAAADIYVDSPAQAKTIGECQHAYKAGRLDDGRLNRFTLGALVAGAIPGRASDTAITLFDSSGVALQDLAAAAMAAQRAAARGLAGRIDLFG